MELRDKSRTNGLLWEVCSKYGWCHVRHQAAAFHELVRSGADADALVDATLLAVGADLRSSARDEYLRRVVEDWLFDPDGQGVRSGLPLL